MFPNSLRRDGSVRKMFAFFMRQLLVFHVSEDTNTERRQSMFQRYSVYICKYLWQLKAEQ